MRVGVTVTVSRRRRRLEHHDQVAGVTGGHLRGFSAKPAGPDDDRQLTGFGRVDGEPAVGPGGDAMFGALRRAR